MISILRDVALNLVKTDPRWSSHTRIDLESYVLATGYADAPRPHVSTSDLIYVYAANLRNSGGAGVNLLRQGEMVRGALQGLIVDNQIKPPQPEALAQLCLDHLADAGIRLTNDDGMYRRQLQAAARVPGELLGCVDALVPLDIVLDDPQRVVSGTGRLHVIHRTAPYADPLLDRLRAALTTTDDFGPMRNRIVYLRLR